MKKQVIEVLDHGRGASQITVPYGCEHSGDFGRLIRDTLIKMAGKRSADKKPTPRVAKVHLDIP